MHPHRWLNKCAEVCHSFLYFALYNVADCELLCCAVPRILCRELHAECNLILIDIFDEYANLIAYLEYLLWALYSAPGHLGNMKQTVCSAKINKRTEICYILNCSL